MRWALIDFSHPFFRSLTRRIVVFCVVAGWTVVEFVGGSMGWGIFFAALTAYVGWGFFISGQADGPLPEADKSEQSAPSEDNK